jgi:hypothetical protein
MQNISSNRLTEIPLPIFTYSHVNVSAVLKLIQSNLILPAMSEEFNDQFAIFPLDASL